MLSKTGSTTIRLAVFAALISTVPLSSDTAHALEPLSGVFVADDQCPAYQSKNRRTNPGNVTTVPGTRYDLLGINEAGGDYYMIRFNAAPSTRDRWVRTTCGHLASKASTTPTQASSGAQNGNSAESKPESTENLLALSWQPAFCETRPKTRECRVLNDGGMPHASGQLSIHGLWPRPKGHDYCGVANSVIRADRPDNWHNLPMPNIDRKTAEALALAMPGVASSLHRHEWIKHGTCYFGAGGADEYFDDTLYLTETIDRSEVGALFRASIGKTLQSRDIRKAFDAAFGRGAGDRVEVKCTADGQRTLIVEIRVNFRGRIDAKTPVAELIQAADRLPKGCKQGIIDRPGLQ